MGRHTEQVEFCGEKPAPEAPAFTTGATGKVKDEFKFNRGLGPYPALPNAGHPIQLAPAEAKSLTFPHSGDFPCLSQRSIFVPKNNPPRGLPRFPISLFFFLIFQRLVTGSRRAPAKGCRPVKTRGCTKNHAPMHKSVCRGVTWASEGRSQRSGPAYFLQYSGIKRTMTV
jgi:hypothetical protein